MPNRLKMSKIQSILAVRQQGWSFTRIAQELGIHRQTVARHVREWLDQAGVQTLFIAKGSPWENGYVESFNGKLRDELLKQEIFLNMEETRWVVDRCQLDYNHQRMHSSLDTRPLRHLPPAALLPFCLRPRSSNTADP